MNQSWNWLKKQKEGIGIGALVGLVMYIFYSVKYQGAMAAVYSVAAQNPTLFDTIARTFTQAPTIQLAPLKIAVGFILFFALVGMLLDALIAPNK